MKNKSLVQILGLKKSNLFLFTLGLTHHLKGARELIMIFHEILDEFQNVILLIGGNIERTNKKVIKKLIKKYNIPANKIITCGFIKEDLLNIFYSNSHLTLYTTIDEAFGLIPLESMLNGTPVISFEGGPSETILDGQTGYVIKNSMSNDFARKTIKLMRDKNLLNKFSENAKKHVRNNFSYNKCVKNLETILQNIINKN